MIKILVAEDEEKSRAATVSRLRGIMGDEALIETTATMRCRWRSRCVRL